MASAHGDSPSSASGDHVLKRTSNPELPPGELLLVRAWDPRTGELIGWMPTRRVAIKLQQLGGPAADFDLNEGVTVLFPRHSLSHVDGGDVRIAPEPVTFQGRRWLPLELEINIVRIRKFLFYVRTIIFADSKWRAPAAGNAAK